MHPRTAPQVLVTAHSLGFWGVWLALGTWKDEALSFGARCLEVIATPKLALAAETSEI
jgi:hypothetical protein